jgi:hypothetical protein
MLSLSPKINSFLKTRSKPSQHLFFVPAARPANESEATLEGSTTTEVAVLPVDEA